MNDAVVLPSISPEQAWQLSTGSLRDPFAVLGPFETEIGRFVRAFLPGASRRRGGRARQTDGILVLCRQLQPDGLFMGRVEGR